MIYERAVYRPLGETGLSIEFGDEATVAVNVFVVAMREALKAHPIPAIRGFVNTTRALGVYYDPFQTSYDELVGELQSIENSAGEVGRIPSRLFRIPIWYNDPWSLECAQAHGVGNNIEYVAEINNLSVEEFIQKHTSTSYWIASLGFIPGAYNAYPLDPEIIFSAPKYTVPRTWTPNRIVAFAGSSVGPYPIVGPGGYQLLGRTPLDLFDLNQKSHIFQEGRSPVLARVSDRQIYIPIEEEEYREIRQQVEEGTYTYDVTYEEFDVQAYLLSLEQREDELV